LETPLLIKTHHLEQAFVESVTYLNSDDAIKSIKLDPYWPKWDSPWWHMSLLYEMGYASYIPDHIIQLVIDMMNTHYLKFFPIHEHELPDGINPYTRIPCHCQLGNMYQILRSKRPDVDDVLPWIRPWFLKYQLPDGGLNCEEDAYKISMKSSIASSLPVFEALMMCAEQTGLSEAEDDFLDKAAAYVIEHRLIHKLTGELMDPDFLKLQFPRYYSYDLLRGLHFITRWRNYRKMCNANSTNVNSTIADNSNIDDVIAYGIEILQSKLKEGMLCVERSDLTGVRTRNRDAMDEWTIVTPASRFTLLDEAGTIGSPSIFLTQQFEQTLALLQSIENNIGK
jgi:hypothetical protein